MDDYKKYLAENILTEDKVITYRLLSRALKVHVNVAKQMLFEFHHIQNGKRPGSIHATYLIHGTKKPEGPAIKVGDDGDVEMASSAPEVDYGEELVPITVLSLVQEDRLHDVLAEYETVSSIHIYSLSSSPTTDFTLLSDAARQTSDLSTKDGVEPSKVYGAIANPNVWRRERRSGAIPAAAPAPAPSKKEAKVAPKPSTAPVPEAAPKVKEETKPTPAAALSKPAASSSGAPAKKAPALKRGGSSTSGIMAAFSKAAAKPKKDSQPATPSGDDVSMHPLSDDGEDDESEMSQPKAREVTGRKSRKQREEELRKMMEDDEDDDEADEEREEEEEPEKEDTPAEEPEEEASAKEPAKEEPSEVVSSTGDGRRRGKRKVMKKKQIMDDQGYLVTIQESGWESFSEDEAPPPPKPKPKAASSAPPAAPAAKPKKAAAKGAQGNIMSFFSKK